MKKAIVIRLGAIGDTLIVTPVFRYLKRDGYHVTFNTTGRAYELVKHNPYIDAFIEHDSSIPPDHRLTEHWQKLTVGHDRVINLTESIEGALSVSEKHPKEFNLPKDVRHFFCNVNFYDRTMAIAGYPEAKGLLPELHFTEEEETIARNFRKKHQDSFFILWVMSGSSYHKQYPHAEEVGTSFLYDHKDAKIVTVGDSFCVLLDFEHPRSIPKSSEWSIRRTMLMTKYADLVIGPDTGILHAAACYDTPKILMLSANTQENISKYWKNTINLSSGVECQPCHRLIYSLRACPVNELYLTPICMADLKKEDVHNAISNVYESWKGKHDVSFHRSRPQAVSC